MTSNVFAQLIASPAAQKGKAQVKAAPKAHAKNKGAAKTTRKADAGAVKTPIRFAVQDFARPKAGNLLAAHTAAFLSLSGMLDGKGVAKTTATKILGARAVQYHTNNGNFDHTADGLILTPKGEEFFVTRNLAVDPEALAAYEAFFTDGKQNPAINIKTPGSIITL